MTNTFLFLDIDGVLNSEAFLKKLDASYITGGYSKTHYAWENQIDHETIDRLNVIVHAVPDAQVVLSSSWRPAGS